MADFKLESWEREPLWLKCLTPVLRKKKFPYLEEKPEIGEWYRIACQECMVATGEPFYADFQKGSENRFLICFVGGGVSWNEYTAARPASMYAKDHDNGYYLTRMDLVTDIQMKNGLFDSTEKNPFVNWSKLVIPYSTGDFHCGTGDFPYTALDGTKRVCYHHGYTNFHAALGNIIDYVKDTEMLLVCGPSGGGFGTSLLTDSIVRRFQECQNTTCLVDSGFYPMDGWHEVARDVWKAPAEIVDRIKTDNITLDALKALNQEFGKRVKILLDCSKTDGAMARQMNKAQHDSFTFTKEVGIEYRHWLRDMMRQVRTDLPDAGIYIFDILDKKFKNMDFTIHTILFEKEMISHKEKGVSCMDWLWSAVNGDIKVMGLEMLEE